VKCDTGLENTFWMDSANRVRNVMLRERDVKSQDQLIPPHCSNHACPLMQPFWGSVDVFQEVRELGLGGGYDLIFTNL